MLITVPTPTEHRIQLCSAIISAWICCKEPHIFYPQPIHFSCPSVCRSRVFCNSQCVRGVFLFATCRRRRGLTLQNSNRSQNRNVKASNLGATLFTLSTVSQGFSFSPTVVVLIPPGSVKESLVLPQQNQVFGFSCKKVAAGVNRNNWTCCLTHKQLRQGPKGAKRWWSSLTSLLSVDVFIFLEDEQHFITDQKSSRILK